MLEEIAALKRARGAQRRGERNGRVKISDSDVDMMRELYEGDRKKPPGERYWTIERLVEKFEISRRQVFHIVGYHQRADRID